jgi:hypothetical protein
VKSEGEEENLRRKKCMQQRGVGYDVEDMEKKYRSFDIREGTLDYINEKIP